MLIRLLKHKLIIHFKIQMELSGRKVHLFIISAHAKK